MHLRFILIPLFLFPLFVGAQIDQKFNLDSVGELIGWEGDLNHFIINEEKQLQLKASTKGKSLISKSITFSDQVEWQFYFHLEFAPSNANQLRIYLFSDSSEIAKSNGYFIEVGETGSADNLKFYRQIGGNKILLGQGMMGSLGRAPAEARVKIVKDDEGFWSFFSAYNGDQFSSLEFQLLDNEIEITQGNFIIECAYTETRKDRFFIDDIYVGEPQVDIEPPQLLRAFFQDENNISLIFNELIEENSALNLDNYELNNLIGKPSEVTFGESENVINLKFSDFVSSSLIHELSISNLKDQSGNIFNAKQEIILASKPKVDELIINEILFDPYPDGEDFVELYNRTNKFLNLSSMEIINGDNVQSMKFEEDIIISPKQYLAITPNAQALYKYYMIPASDNILEAELPAFSNMNGNVSIALNGSEEIIDSYDYEESMHSEWIDDTEGVSLERIDPAIGAEIDNNWQSASRQSGFATPGYQNSNFNIELIDQTEFELKKKTFSPDGDGHDDELEISYQAINDGIVLNMRIFDDRGHLVRTLANNQILNRTGSVIWDGINDKGVVASMGIYIIWIEYFNTEGTIAHKKLTCVLAKQLN